MGRVIWRAILLGGIGSGFGCVCGCGSGGGDDDGDRDDGDDVTDGDRADADMRDDVLRVVSTFPDADAMRADPDEPIVITFSDSVRTETIDEQTFAASGPTGAATGGFVVEGETVTFMPVAPLHLLGRYSVTLTTGIESEEGATLAAAYEFSFRVDDGQWSGRIDLAEDVAEFLEVARNRRGDMLLPYTSSGEPPSIKAVRFDSAQRAFSLPAFLEDEDQPFAGPRAAINEDGEAIAAWSAAGDPATRSWVRGSRGAWGEAATASGTVGRLGLTADRTAVMASLPGQGADTSIEVLSPGASSWTAPAIALPAATLAGVLASADRVELVAFDEDGDRLVARGYAQATGLSPAQPLSPAGVSASSIHLQVLPGQDLGVSWVQDATEIWHARFDGASDTWSSQMLAAGVLGSAVCANQAGERVAAYVADGSIFAVHAPAGKDFAPPENLGSPAGMEYARCAIDQLGNGLLFWARPQGKSFHARYADGSFTRATQLGDGPTLFDAVPEPDTGRVRALFYNGERLTALAFE
jgi:Bacterial Ig-like domain